MFDAIHNKLDTGLHHYRIVEGEKNLSFSRALDLLEHDAGFRQFLVSLLAASPFIAFRWETPAISATLVGRDFEFVLINSPGLAIAADTQPFADHFKDSEGAGGVVSFDNLGGDATLVVPLPQATCAVYSHLAAFVRAAPEMQVHALWRRVARTARLAIMDRTIWLNTAGAGVAWLHVRLDLRPKYYDYEPYKTGS